MISIVRYAFHDWIFIIYTSYKHHIDINLSSHINCYLSSKQKFVRKPIDFACTRTFFFFRFKARDPKQENVEYSYSPCKNFSEKISVCKDVAVSTSSSLMQRKPH